MWYDKIVIRVVYNDKENVIMSMFQYYSLERIVRFFIEQGKEGECWDFKQEWHEKVVS